MDIRLKMMLLKFAIYLVLMLLVQWYAGDTVADMLSPPEERDFQREANGALTRLKSEMPRLKNLQLSSAEITVASCVQTPESDTGFASIGGHEAVKHELMLHLVVPLRHPDIFFRKASLRPPTGVLFTGPPGTGKTCLARAVASECGMPFLNIKPSLIESKYFGESEKIVKAVFTLAAKLMPCIVFIDEIDSMLRSRSDHEQSHTYSIKTQFLQEMDRIDKENLHVVVIAATNNPATLDQALYRRLPRTYHIGNPDKEARLDILKMLTKEEQPPVPPQHLLDVVSATGAFSGSDLKDVYKAASAMRNEVFSGLILRDSTISCSPGPITPEHWAAAVAKAKQSRRLTSARPAPPAPPVPVRKP